MAIHESLLVKEIDGELNFVYPATSSDIVKHDDSNVYIELKKINQNKVDCVDGMQLSTNDFTDEYRRKLNNIEDHANKYILPHATEDEIGGIITGIPTNIIGVLDENNQLLFNLEDYLLITRESDLYNSVMAGLPTNALSIVDKEDQLIFNLEDYVVLIREDEAYGNNSKKYPINITSEDRLYAHVPWQSPDALCVLIENPNQVDEEIFCILDEYTVLDGNAYIPKATKTTDGLMHKEDKRKLDTIEWEANNYILPPASAEELGGMKLGHIVNNKLLIYNITDNEYISNDQEIFMMDIDTLEYINLDDYNVENDIVVNEEGKMYNNRKYKVQLDYAGRLYIRVPWINTLYNLVTDTKDGLMSKEDKIKLNKIDLNYLGHPEGISIFSNSNDASHNTIYRGKCLDDVYSKADLLTKIHNGEFTDLYIGDYITLNGVKFLFAEYNCNNARLVGKNCINTLHPMDENRYVDNYFDSYMNNYVLKALSEDLEIENYNIDLLSVHDIYNGLPLFRLNKSDILACMGDTTVANIKYWTNDAVNFSTFNIVDTDGSIKQSNVNKELGVRIQFLI